MMINLLSLAFILGMFLLWGQQGIFSAFLHLAGVIAAMVLSLATWDMLAHWMLGTETLLSHHAWGLSLLAPFVLWLGLFRFAFGYIVPGNVFFSPMTNQIGGGVLGGIAAFFVCGFTIIGLNFLPLPGGVAGYKPLSVDAGRIETAASGHLWIPFDRWTDNFLHMISRGSMGTGRPLDEYIGPSLLEEAVIYRLAMEYHENLPLSAPADSVRLEWARVYEGLSHEVLPPAAQINLGPHQRVDETQRLVWVRLAWTLSPVSAGNEGVIRLPPTQLRLTGRDAGGGGTQVISPIGGILRGSPSVFYPTRGSTLRDILQANFAGRDTVETDWLFMVPNDVDPRFLRVRNLRFDLSDLEQLLVEDPTPESLAANEPFTGLAEVHRDRRELAEMDARWEWSDRLPTTFGRAQLSGRGNEYDNGAFLRATHQRADRGDRHLDRVAVPAGYRSVRVILSPEDVDAMAAVEADSDAGAEPNHYWLEYEREDGERRKAAPVGYIYRDEDNEFSFAVRATLEGFNDIDDVPLIRTRRGVRPRAQGEDFYLYFPVPEGGTPTAIGVRDQTAQELGEPDDND